MGLAATRVPWLRRRYVGERSLWAREQLERRLPSAVLLARVIPGLRLVTYTACGFVRVPLLPFTAWVLLAVTLWTLGLYGLSVAIGHALAEQPGPAAPGGRGPSHPRAGRGSAAVAHGTATLRRPFRMMHSCPLT